MSSVDATHPALPRWKRLLFTGVFLLLLACILEGGARLYLRMFRGYDGRHLYQYAFDPYKNILPTPNYVDTRGIRHNAQGFRHDTDVPREKPAETCRIFLMGGSTAYGLGGLWPHLQREFEVLDNSQTIDTYLERDLRDALPGRKIEVINAAITSTWTHHSLIYLNQSILGYSPDMVLFLDGFNDAYFYNEDHDQFGSYSYSLPSRVILGEPTFTALVYANGWWLFRRSAFANLAGRGLRFVKLLVTPRKERKPIDVDQALAGLYSVFPRNALKMHRRMALILKDEGVTPVFMLQPMLVLERGHKPMSEMEQKLFDFNVSSYLPNYEAYSGAARDFVAREEARNARETGASFLDLTTVFAGRPQQMYTDYAHLTPLGNELVAARIRDQILPLLAEHANCASPR